VTKQGPFTLTGDISDAVCPLLNEALQHSNLLFPLRKHYSIPKQRNSTSDKSTTDEIHSKRTSVVSHTTDHTMSRYKKVNNFKNSNQRRRLISEKPPIKSSFSKSKKPEFQLKFAEQMQKNQDEFLQFCKDHQHSSQSLEKREVQTYLTAIFGQSPFSDIKIEPLKTLPRHNQLIFH